MEMPTFSLHKRIAYSLLVAMLSLAGGGEPVQAETIPAEYYLSGVVGHAQSYTLSCESRSASDWAAYFGVSASEYDILSALPRTDNPETGFVGSPSGGWGNIPPDSYGVHAPPIARVLRSFGVNAQDRQGMAWDELRQEIASGRPVIVWIIGQMWPGTPISYTARDGQTTTVAYFEHTVIVTGYSPSFIYIVDAYSGQDQIYDLNAFLISWAVLGQRAVVLAGDIPAKPTVAPYTEQVYTVQPGETLSGLAEQFNTPWQSLADLNQIPYPYLLYSGQTLRLPDSIDAPIPEVTPMAEPSPTPSPILTETTNTARTHVVRSGETLLELANQYQVTWQELVAANELIYPYFIYADQALRLPVDAAKGTPTAAPTDTVELTATLQPTADRQTYTVQPGDTLMKLGRRFKLDWNILAQANSIFYPYVIYPGQSLEIP
ncbi:MAG: LysM peptidoglycan-binding domain-containing protein [Anaerolineaceae bacterium]|nr:LysM peptidoglycan-binding domain-containing protein [Anaerolineaceae bacterium]